MISEIEKMRRTIQSIGDLEDALITHYGLGWASTLPYWDAMLQHRDDLEESIDGLADTDNTVKENPT